jgi:hypothetical protein
MLQFILAEERKRTMDDLGIEFTASAFKVADRSRSIMLSFLPALLDVKHIMYTDYKSYFLICIDLATGFFNFFRNKRNGATVPLALTQKTLLNFACA